MKRFFSLLIKLMFFAVLLVLVFRFYVVPNVLYPQKYSAQVEKYSEEYNLDKYLVYSVIRTESNFEKEAVSHKNAYGLMQITESTAKWAAEKIGMNDFKTDDLFDENINIELGCWCLRTLLDQFENEDTAICAYNAGSGNVSNWLADPRYSHDGKTLYEIPYGETKQYIEKINLTQEIYRYLYEG